MYTHAHSSEAGHSWPKAPALLAAVSPVSMRKCDTGVSGHCIQFSSVFSGDSPRSAINSVKRVSGVQNSVSHAMCFGAVFHSNSLLPLPSVVSSFVMPSEPGAPGTNIFLTSRDELGSCQERRGLEHGLGGFGEDVCVRVCEEHTGSPSSPPPPLLDIAASTASPLVDPTHHSLRAPVAVRASKASIPAITACGHLSPLLHLRPLEGPRTARSIHRNNVITTGNRGNVSMYDSSNFLSPLHRKRVPMVRSQSQHTEETSVFVPVVSYASSSSSTTSSSSASAFSQQRRNEFPASSAASEKRQHFISDGLGATLELSPRGASRTFDDRGQEKTGRLWYATKSRPRQRASDVPSPPPVFGQESFLDTGSCDPTASNPSHLQSWDWPLQASLDSTKVQRRSRWLRGIATVYHLFLFVWNLASMGTVYIILGSREGVFYLISIERSIIDATTSMYVMLCFFAMLGLWFLFSFPFLYACRGRWLQGHRDRVSLMGPTDPLTKIHAVKPVDGEGAGGCADPDGDTSRSAEEAQSPERMCGILCGMKCDDGWTSSGDVNQWSSTERSSSTKPPLWMSSGGGGVDDSGGLRDGFPPAESRDRLLSSSGNNHPNPLARVPDAGLSLEGTKGIRISGEGQRPVKTTVVPTGAHVVKQEARSECRTDVKSDNRNGVSEKVESGFAELLPVRELGSASSLMVRASPRVAMDSPPGGVPTPASLQASRQEDGVISSPMASVPNECALFHGGHAHADGEQQRECPSRSSIPRHTPSARVDGRVAQRRGSSAGLDAHRWVPLPPLWRCFRGLDYDLFESVVRMIHLLCCIIAVISAGSLCINGYVKMGLVMVRREEWLSLLFEAHKTSRATHPRLDTEFSSTAVSIRVGEAAYPTETLYWLCEKLQLQCRCSGFDTPCVGRFASEKEAYLAACPYCPAAVQERITEAAGNWTCSARFENTKRAHVTAFMVLLLPGIVLGSVSVLLTVLTYTYAAWRHTT